MKKYHNWHIVNLSPWPLFVAWDLFILPIGLVCFFQGYKYGLFIFFFGFLFLFILLFNWFRDIVIEGTIEGYHTKCVKRSFVIIFLLFIFSEVMFFVAFFWAYFHSNLAPTHNLGLIWPPKGCLSLMIHPFDFPFLNTLLLLLSGFTLTLGHHYLKAEDTIENRNNVFYSFLVTIGLGVIFMIIQCIEYVTANFNISYNIWGSTFYMCTGFHGFHVIIGLIFLIVMCIRFSLKHFSRSRHIGFEVAAWYWHFVDVVWIFLFFSIYLFGSIGCVYAPLYNITYVNYE